MNAAPRPDPLPPPVLVVGPTAVGKSEVALELARRIGGEIISVDSMQVYRGMDIGTAKPSLEARQGVPHHLVDVAGIGEQFDAAQFVSGARRALQDCRARGRVPILCGGTGLYFKALLEGLGNAPAPDPALRAALESRPLEELLRELSERDPVSFERIDRRNPRRVIRAVEVLRLTGQPFSNQRARWEAGGAGLGRSVGFGLTRGRADLVERIHERVEAMFRLGLVQETERLLEAGLAENRTAMQALGYRQVAEHLGGERPLAETIELVKIRTRQFAKRQMTWFKRQIRLTWISLRREQSAGEVADLLAAELAKTRGEAK